MRQNATYITTFLLKIQSAVYCQRNYSSAPRMQKNTIPLWFIKDPELQQLSMNVCNPLTEFDSKLINHNALVVDQGFQFTFDIPIVIFRPLTKEELSKQVVKHQKEDRQYIFNGAPMPQEKSQKRSATILLY